MTRTSHNIGQLAENACCRYLEQKGLKLVTRNYRSKLGEIDIIMQEDNTLIFVEVRYRKNNYFGDGLESINTQKQKRILATAEQYLQSETGLKNARIDVVAMTQKLQNTNSLSYDNFSFEWIKDAF